MIIDVRQLKKYHLPPISETKEDKKVSRRVPTLFWLSHWEKEAKTLTMYVAFMQRTHLPKCLTVNCSLIWQWLNPWATMLALHFDCSTVALPRSFHVTENWLSSRSLTSFIIWGLIFPSWHQPLTFSVQLVNSMSFFTFFLFDFDWKIIKLSHLA